MTTENAIEIDERHPITINGKPIVCLVAKPQKFRGYGAMVDSARQAKNFNIALFREWALRNVEARDASGAAVPFTLKDLLEFPLPHGARLQKLQRASTDPAGSMVKDGNGVDEPCVYKLGKPLPGGKPEAEITELEFMLKTIGDVEAVMAGESRFDQVTALLETCATPLGADVTLQRLPGFAMDALTLVDGLTVMETVMPRFIESARA